MEQKTIGEFIALLRKESGITQKQLAEKLNVSDKTISHWERGESSPDLSVIPLIADIFGVTCDELIRGKRNEAVSEIVEISEEQKKAEIIKKLEKNLNKLNEKFAVCFMLIIFGTVIGMFFGSVSKNATLGVMIFAFFILLSLFGMMLSNLLYHFSLKSNAVISKDLRKTYVLKGGFLGCQYMDYSCGVIFLILAAVMIMNSITFKIYKIYIFVPIWFAVMEPVFFLLASIDYKKKKFHKKLSKTAVILSLIMIIVIAGTVGFQQNFYKKTTDITETTMRFIDVYEFEQFMEIENKVAFNRKNAETIYLYDEKDNDIEVQWNNELVFNYQIEYDENDEYIASITASVLPDKCLDNQHRVPLALFQCGFFVYPAIAIILLSVFGVKVKRIKRKEKKIAD